MIVADVYLAKKDTTKEKATLAKLWSEHPHAPDAADAASRLGDVAKLSLEAKVARGAALIEANQNASGLAVLEPLLPALKLPEPLACRAHFALGKGYRKQRQHARAVSFLEPTSQKCKDQELRAKALFTLGFSQSIVAKQAAPRTYALLARDYPSSPLADDALFNAGDVLLREGRTREAVERLIELVDRYPSGDFAGEALFKLFWAAATDERFDEAEEFLSEIEGRFAQSEDSYERERAAYWRGRLRELQGRPEEAAGILSALAQAHPATYYGLIARERAEFLTNDGPIPPGDGAPTKGLDPFPLPLGSLAADPQFRSAIELVRLGFGDHVATEVLAIDRSGLPPASLRLLVLVLAEAGAERQAHGMARLWLRRDLAGPLTPERRAIWEVAYPEAFRELVTQHAKSADELDPELLQALMREESALDPHALSWAGALGLCQLMPATAAGVAMQLRVRQPTRAQLLEPNLNIRLGARYLSDLVRRARGVKQFALAGYNAGEGAVARWRRDNGDDDLAAWVEQIPLQETRGYVKRVLRSYNTYKLLYHPTERPRTVVPVLPKPLKVQTSG
jgi:soluble lytic murein transglycosylase